MTPKPRTDPSQDGNDDFAHNHAMMIIREKREAVEHLERENARMRAALLLVAEWRLPYPRFSFNQGSNGERDFFRDIAQRALDGDL